MPLGSMCRTAVLGLLLLVPLSLKGAAPDPVQTPQAAQSARSLADDLFAIASPLQLALHIPEEGISTLRQTQRLPSGEARPEADATVLEGGREYLVTVRLKGASSFRPIDATPSFTVHFDKRVPSGRFHGLTKISLNNSVQDPTRLHEALARELFAAAGVPVPRATFAHVTLNGRALGLYVLTEGFDKRFLERHFARTDGNLYEGGLLQDITSGLQRDTGRNPQSDVAVERLILAAHEPDPEERFRTLSAVLDLDRFLSMVAIETMLSHSDSYSMNRNNYRLYHDPATDRIVFMPHGMDRVLGTHRAALDLSIVPPRLGLVARALLSTAEGRRRYVDRVAALFQDVFRPDALCRRARELDVTTGLGNAALLCERIVTRATELEFQLANRAALVEVLPTPAFDDDGVARIAGWRPASRRGGPPASLSVASRDGVDVLHLQTSVSSRGTSLQTRFSLPAGLYRLAGRIAVAGAPPESGASSESSPLPVSMIRVAAARFAYDRRSLGSGDIDVTFRVSDAMSPEEIELTFDVPGAMSDAWIDASSLTLVSVGGSTQ
jgi:spore coat protein H